MTTLLVLATRLARQEHDATKRVCGCEICQRIAREHSEHIGAFSTCPHPTCRLVREPPPFTALIERWQAKAEMFKAASREANHAGKVELDAYRDGQRMAFEECIYDLGLELGAAPAGRVVPPPQIDLDEKAATVLRENLSKLYEDDPSRVEPGATIPSTGSTASGHKLVHKKHCAVSIPGGTREWVRRDPRSGWVGDDKACTCGLSDLMRHLEQFSKDIEHSISAGTADRPHPQEPT